MTLNYFDLKVTSTAHDLVRLLIILNPKKIAKVGSNYNDYHATAWKVLDFSATPTALGDPQPQTVRFNASVTAVLKEDAGGDQLKGGAFLQITPTNNTFNVTEVRNANIVITTLEANNRLDNDVKASFANKNSNTAVVVGLGDLEGKPYIAQGLSDSEVKFDFKPEVVEFAIVPIDYKIAEGEKVVRHTAAGRWYTFELRNVKSPNPSVTYDGQAIIVPSGVTVVEHEQSEPLF
ncbi:hypothetical protein BKA57DRAFT_469488, partial [Linnemannia elongata]